MRGSGILIVLSAAIILSSCAGSEPDVEMWSTRGQAAVIPLKKALKEALINGMADGPEAALAVCRVEAPEIAARVSTNGVTVGRTSHKLRNPDNAPKEWMKPLLDDYLTGADDRTPRVVRIDGGRIGYVEPIYAEGLCVTCHGATLTDNLAERIHALYPHDAATGFEVGDFRGLFWVEFAANN